MEMEIPSFMQPKEPSVFEEFEEQLQRESDASFARIVAADESKFDKLKNKLAHRKGVTNPAGLAAYIGREKYGKAGMAKKAAAGRDCSGMDAKRRRFHDAVESLLSRRSGK